jgi:hypothetical protein
MTAALAPATHFEFMAWLVKELALARIQLEEHQYRAGASGSFVVVLTGGLKEVRMTWDGRDALLSVDCRQTGSGTWNHDASISVSKAEELYAEIASQATEMLAA